MFFLCSFQIFQSTSMKSLPKQFLELENMKKSILSALLKSDENKNEDQDQDPTDRKDKAILKSKKSVRRRPKKIKSIILDFYGHQPIPKNKRTRKCTQDGDIDFKYVFTYMLRQSFLHTFIHSFVLFDFFLFHYILLSLLLFCFIFLSFPVFYRSLTSSIWHLLEIKLLHPTQQPRQQIIQHFTQL